MLITNLLLAGSVAYAGVRTVIQPKQPVVVPPKKSAQGAAVIVEPTTAPQSVINAFGGELTLAERRHLAVAATSFWLNVGGFFFAPLTFVSIPLTIYSTVPVLEAGCRSLYAEGRLKPSVINSILLVSTLATEHYFSAATIAWLHHTFRQVGRRLQNAGEQVKAEINGELGDLLRQALGEAPDTIWVVNSTSEGQTVELKVPFTEVKIGDIVVVNKGEFVPVEGVVTAGAAKLNLLLLNRSPTPVAVSVGDHVATAAFVMEGRLCVQVEQLRPSNAP